MVTTAGRRAMAGHRQVGLLGVAALFVLVAVVVTGAAQLQRARTELDHAEQRIHPAKHHLDAAEQHLASLVSQYLRLLTVTEDEGPTASSNAALIGRAHEAATGAWREFKSSSLDLPGEAALATRLSVIMDIETEEGMAILDAMAPVSKGDAAGLVARLTEVRVTIDGLAPAELAVDQLLDLYDTAEERAKRRAAAQMAAAATSMAVLSLLLGLPLFVAFVLVMRATRRREREVVQADLARLADADRNAFEARLQRAFDIVQTEEATFPIVERALATASSGVPAELLVADSSRAHLRQVATTEPVTGGPGCAVGSPLDCPAAQRGQTQVFSSSEEIDACPHLRGRPEGERAAVCVPVSIGGKTAGVVHAATAVGTMIPTETVVRLELVARKAGDRLGMLRAFTRSETQARTDPLTGLLNRRSLEIESREAVDSGAGYAVAFGDLDHFKQLNDVHGHDAGDRALRLFARVLRDSVRPNDIPARYGGEEFLVVLPACSVGDAAAVIDRVRARLAEALLLGSVPGFTVSFGVASSDDGARLHDVIDRADAAVLAAKAAGRDRTLISGGSVLGA